MSLKDDDIKTTRSAGRRKFLSKLGVSVAGAAALLVSSQASAKDARDFVPADSKSQDLDKSKNADKKRDSDKKSGDQA